jgi:acetoin utilization protein AcuB
MTTPVLVKEFMTPAPFTCRWDDSLRTVLDLMTAKCIRHVPVLKDGLLVGVVSQRDADLAVALGGGDPLTITALGAARAEVFTAEPDASLARVAHDMAQARRGSAVIVRGTEVVGILTSVDLARALAEVLTAEHRR